MSAISYKPDSFRRYVIKLQTAAFYYVQNKIIGVSTECAVFIISVHVELTGEQTNVNHMA